MNNPIYHQTLFYFQVLTSELPAHISLHTTAIRSGCTISIDPKFPSLSLIDDHEKTTTDLELSFLAFDVLGIIALADQIGFRYILKVSPELILRSKGLPAIYLALYQRLYTLKTTV
jgi:hypothetical protein